MQESHYLVPAQLSGYEKNFEHSVHVRTIEDAEDWFVDAKERLLDVNNWRKYSTGINMDFRVMDIHGKVLPRKAHNRDHIRIEIAPVSFDWATIEALEYDDYPDIHMETFAMRIRQRDDPTNSRDGSLYNNATSTFVIERVGKRLSAAYHGRNEPGNDSNGTAWLGLSDAQLADLLKGLIDLK